MSLKIFHILIFFNLYGLLWAQTRLDSIQHIPEVFVTADKYKEIIPPQRLSGKELAGLSSHSVADAIRYFSGLQIKDYGGIGGVKTVNIRSMGSHHVGVFYDGIQLGNAQNGQVDLGRFSLDNMENISLHYGQKSEIFQPARDFGSSGTIYLQTKRPRFEEHKKYNLWTTLRTGSFGLFNPSVLWEQYLSPGINLSVNTEFTFATGRYHFREKSLASDHSVAWDTTGTRHNGDIRSGRAEVTLFGNTPRANWNLKNYFYESERGIPGAIVNNNWRRYERQRDRNLFFQGEFQKNIGCWYRFQIKGKYAYDYLHFLRESEKELYINNHYHQYEFYFTLSQLVRLYDWWEIDLSADFQWNKLNADLHDFAFPQRFSEWIALATNLRFGPVAVQGSVLGTFVKEKVEDRKAAAAAPAKQIFSPALFASYVPFSEVGLTLRAFYKHCFRMPTFNDLYYTEIGNAYLKPEFTAQYNLGFLYETRFHSSWFKGISMQTDAYYNDVDNKIIAYPKGGQFRWTMINLGKVKIKGVDIASRFDFRLNELFLNCRVNYTWQQAQDLSDPESDYYGNQVHYIPLHSGSAVAALHWKNWQMNYNFIYTGSRYTRSVEEPEYYLPSWKTADLSVRYCFAYHRIRTELTGEINNILNQHYNVVEGYPMPGRNYKFIIRFML